MRGGGKAWENALDWQCMLPPDLILHNGKIITLDASSRVAQAVTVRAGLIASVGEDAALL
jgi:predicted amidohydrolase YtcJ